MIALLTDFGMQDAYVAQMKGVILAINPHACLIDLTHDVAPFDIPEAAYVLELATRFLPPDAIVVAVVDPGVGTARRPVLLRSGTGTWFIGPDNGLFSRVIERHGVTAAYVLQEVAYFRVPVASTTFHGRDIFAPVAAHLAQGVSPERFGPRITDLLRLPSVSPRVVGDTVHGTVLHVDHFGNIVTNLTREHLPQVIPGQELCLTVGDKTYRLPLYHTYGAAPADRLMCLINSDEAFEIAVSQGRAAAALGVQAGARFVLTVPHGTTAADQNDTEPQA